MLLRGRPVDEFSGIRKCCLWGTAKQTWSTK